MIEKVNAWLGRRVGPNAAHVVDGLVGWALAGAATWCLSSSARTFADRHPELVVALPLAAAALAGAASKFRKAAAAKKSSAPPPSS